MRGKIKSVLASVLSIIFVIVATLIGLEIVLRSVADRLPMAVLLYFHRDLKNSLPAVKTKIEEVNPWTTGLVEDPDLGWTFQPESLAEGVNEDGEAFSFKTSPEGFYTSDQPDKDAAQLIVLGDSFLSTFYVKKPIVWVLHEELGLPVYNLSVGGWGPESYRAAYNKFGKHRNSKLVVVFTFNNDITDVDNWSRWKASGESISFRAWLWQNDSSVVNLGSRWPDRYLILWNLTKLAVKNARSNEYDLTGTFQDEILVRREYFHVPKPEKGFRLQFTKGYQFMTLDPEAFAPGGSYWPYMDVYFQSLDRLRVDIEKQGGKMLLIWIPSKERVYLPLLPEDLYRQYVTNPSGEIDGLERALHYYVEEQDIYFFDLTPELMNRARERQKLYFTVDGHLNSLGNQVVGECVASAVRELLKDVDSQ